MPDLLVKLYELKDNTELRLFLDHTTLAGRIAGIVWILSGASATIVGLISLIKAKKVK